MLRTALTMICAYGLLLMSLAGCSTAGDHYAENDGPLTPMPERRPVIDPDDTVFIDEITKHIADKKAPSYTRYEFSRIDLDGDGRRDALAYVTFPYHYWCSKDGCTLLVFKAGDNHFKMLSQITPVQNPVLVSDHKTYGWKDIIVHVPAPALDYTSKDVALSFNGKGYPERPFMEPPLYTAYSRKGTKFFQ